MAQLQLPNENLQLRASVPPKALHSDYLVRVTIRQIYKITTCSVFVSSALCSVFTRHHPLERSHSSRLLCFSGAQLAEHHILIAEQLSWAAVQESASASHGARGEADAGADAEGVARAGVHRRALPRRLRVLPAPPGGHTAQRRRHLEGIRRSEGRAVPAAVGKGGGGLREFPEEAANGLLEEADGRRGGGQEVAQLLGVDYLERKEG